MKKGRLLDLAIVRLRYRSLLRRSLVRSAKDFWSYVPSRRILAACTSTVNFPADDYVVLWDNGECMDKAGVFLVQRTC